MDEVKFGTSGLRGRVSDLNDALCQAYTVAFLHLMQAKKHLGDHGSLLIGYDLRPSSPSIAGFVASAAQSHGIKVENCGALPTPALALAAFSRRCPAIMVTGSHIPADRNGLKFYSPDGEIDKEDELVIRREMERAINVKNTHLEPASLPPFSKTSIDSYMAWVGKILPAHALDGLRIGIYQHSCVGRDLLGEVLTAFGAQIEPFGRCDLFRSLDTEALDEHTKTITAQAARTHQLDAIVSTDGDGDRPLIAGQDGLYLRGDNIGLLCAQFLKAECVVTPITSNSHIEICGFFKQVYRCQIGSPHVLAGMARAKEQGFKSIIGFEANGGVLLGSDIILPHGERLPALATRDALLPILAVLGLAQSQAVPVHLLNQQLPPRFTASDRLENVEREAAAHFLLSLATDSTRPPDFYPIFGSIQNHDQMDGQRFILDNGDIIHFRASGNAPELRCYSEASTIDKAQSLVQQGLAYARAHM